MKISGVIITVVLVALISVLATLHFSKVAPWSKANSFAKTMETADVKFEVDEVAGELVITSGPGPGCTKKGCFKVSKGKSGRLDFKFNAGPEWQLTELKICRGATKQSRACSLDVWERMEFAASDTKRGPKMFYTTAGGIIDLTGVKPGASHSEFYLFDQNALRRMYFYSIQACKKTESEADTDTGEIKDEAVDAAIAMPIVTTTCYTTDPPLDNGGRL
jgi:hypothetical protein